MKSGNPIVRWLIFFAIMAVPIVLVVMPMGSFLILSLFRAEKNLIIREVNLNNYLNFFGNWTYVSTYLGSLLLCFEVALLSILVGYPVAWFIWRRKGRRRYLLLLLAVVPLFMSYIVKLYTLRSMLGLNGLLNQLLMGIIFSQFGLAYDWPFGSAMAAILFVTALAGIGLAGYALNRQRI